MRELDVPGDEHSSDAWGFQHGSELKYEGDGDAGSTSTVLEKTPDEQHTTGEKRWYDRLRVKD